MKKYMAQKLSAAAGTNNHGMYEVLPVSYQLHPRLAGVQSVPAISVMLSRLPLD
jgi:hypothetical protein